MVATPSLPPKFMVEEIFQKMEKETIGKEREEHYRMNPGVPTAGKKREERNGEEELSKK